MHHLSLIAWNAVALLVYMSICFGIAYRRKRLNTVDAAWGGGFVVVAWLVAGLQWQLQTVLIALLIDIWAIRLTHHLLNRIVSSPKDDPRYEAIASKWSRQYFWLRAYISVFLLQGLLILIISLPTVFAAGSSLDYAPVIIAVGTSVWLVGFIVETIADRQLAVFVKNTKHKGKVLDTGLWRRSRHPNYLGEIVQWYGIGIIACSTRYGWIGMIGPVTLNILVRFISGVPPIEKRKQKDTAYRQYMARTNPILPRLKRV